MFDVRHAIDFIECRALAYDEIVVGPDDPYSGKKLYVGIIHLTYVYAALAVRTRVVTLRGFFFAAWCMGRLRQPSTRLMADSARRGIEPRYSWGFVIFVKKHVLSFGVISAIPIGDGYHERGNTQIR